MIANLERAYILRRIERWAIQINSSSYDYDYAQDVWRQSKSFYRQLLKCKRELFWRNKLLTESNNSRLRWRSFNALLGRQNSKASEHLCAAAFETFFSDKIENIISGDSGEPIFCALPDDVSISLFTPITISMVSSTILSLSNKRSSSDPLPTSILKECIDMLSPFLTDLVNDSFARGCFPQLLAISCVTPVMKKEKKDIDLLTSYRPISNLSVISKLLERLALKTHFHKYDLLPQHQSAYRRHRSTETAVIHVLNDLLSSIDTVELNLIAALDISAAFDSLLRHLDKSTLKIIWVV